jgi:hypothetical protein
MAAEAMEDDYDPSDPHSGDHPEAVETELLALREEAARQLSPEFLSMSDFLMKSLDLKFQSRMTSAKRTAEKAVKTAERAEKTANKAKEETVALRTELETIRSEMTEQGKKIALLEERQNSARLEYSAVSEQGLLGKETKTESPSQRVGKLRSKFLTLIQKKEKANAFILGRKSGYPTTTRITAKGVMSVFFPGIKCVVTKPEKAEFARVLVTDPNDAKQVQEALKSVWSELASQGWWMTEDSPEQLRKLEARARSFVAFSKRVNPANKKLIGYVEIERGFLVKNGGDILHLFMIPTQSGKNWEPLVKMFVNRVQAIDADDLFGQYCDDSSEGFYINWLEKAGMNLLAADVRAIRDAPTSASSQQQP